MMRKVMMAALGGTALLMGGIGGANAALIIDSFDTPFFNAQDGDGRLKVGDLSPVLPVTPADIRTEDASIDSTLGLDILGGTRKALLGLDTDAANVPANAVAEAFIAASVGNFNVPSGLEATLSLIYDNSPLTAADFVDTIGLGGVDLTAGGVGFEFAIDAIEVDPGIQQDSFVTVNVWDMVGGFATFTQAIFLPVLEPGETFTLPFALFPGVELTDVGALQFLIGGGRALDLRIAQLYVPEVPEPATLGILGLGLAALGFGVARRNRRTV